MRLISKLSLTASALALLPTALLTADDVRPATVGFETDDHQVQVLVDGERVASYVFADDRIPRPYFAHVRGRGGMQLTRNHPPIAGQDRTDHDTMHPGIWLAFGDLDGEDFWRNKAHVVHHRFISEPAGSGGSGGFVEEKHYRRNDGTIVCRERFRWEFRIRPSGYLMMWDSTFSSDREFYFGDQEEMGLGIRVTTPISEIEGGRISDAKGRTGAKAVWGNAADWCDYSGILDGVHLGIAIFCHPDNFRPSWMHARDYGFVAANAFGRKAMRKGDVSKVVVKPGETIRLRYGLLLHNSKVDDPVDISAAHADYVQLANDLSESLD